MTSQAQPGEGPRGKLLIVDDEDAYRERLGLSMRRRGYEVWTCSNRAAAIQNAQRNAPDHVLVDLRLGQENGLDLVTALRQILPDATIVVLTGYGSIASALEAVRAGASDYRTKPLDGNQIAAVLEGKQESIRIETPSLDRVEWEHIHRVLADCDGNVSRAARELGIDRRSLQRKLARFPPPR